MFFKFSKIRLMVQKNSMLFKILISYIIIGTILLSLLSYILYNRFSQTSVKEINAVCEKMLFQSYKTAEKLFKSSYEYFFSAYLDDPIIFNALYAKKFKPLELVQINRKLNELLNSNSLDIVHSVYIYNFNAGYVFSNFTTTKTIDEFPDKDIIKYISKSKTVLGPVFVPRKVNFGEITKNKNDVNVLSLILLDTTIVKDMDSAIIFNFDQKVLQEILTQGEKNYSSNTFIINKEGIIISHQNFDMINKRMADINIMKKVLSSQKGYLSMEIDGHKSLITFISSEWLGWIFISIGQYRNLLGRLESLKNYILVITIMFLAVALIISIFFTSRIYIPMHNLLKKIKGGRKYVYIDTHKPLGEYDLIEKTLDRMAKNVQNLKTSISSCLPAKKKELAIHILKGEITRIDDFKKDIEAFDVNLNAPFYVVCVLRIDSFSSLCREHGTEDIALLRFSISNIAHKHISGKFSFETVEDLSDHVAVIVNMRSDSLFELKKIKDHLHKSQTEITNLLKITVTVSIGTVVDSIKSISRSYQNSLLSTNYRLIYGKGSLIESSDIIDREHEKYEYPLDKETQLLDSLKLCSRENVCYYLDQIISHVSRYIYDEILLSLTQLAIASLRSAKEIIRIDSHCHKNLQMDYQLINRRLMRLDTLEEMREWFASLYMDIIDKLESQKKNNKSETVDTLKRLIRENYNDQSLSIDRLSQLVGFSTNYVRNIFKQCTGISISSYISEIRFEKTKDLLINTEYPAKKVAEIAGFTSTGYFYTNFKKTTGKTPNQFRREFKLDELEKNN